MNRTEHLLSCLAEECAEVAHRVSKALRFGLREVQPGQALTNAERIHQEIVDLYAVIEMLEEGGLIIPPRSFNETHAAMTLKMQKVEKFMTYARTLGTLRDEVAS